MKTSDEVDVNELIDLKTTNTTNDMTNGLVDVVPDTANSPVLPDAPIAGNPIEDAIINNKSNEEKSFVDLAAIDAASSASPSTDGVPAPESTPSDDMLLDDANDSYDPVDFS